MFDCVLKCLRAGVALKALILGTEKAASKSFSVVRTRLADYDFVKPSPVLGKYGDAGIREAEQYFLDDTNTPLACPFHKLKD